MSDDQNPQAASPDSAGPDSSPQAPPPSTSTIPLLTHLGVSSYDGDVLYDNKQYIDEFLKPKLDGARRRLDDVSSPQYLTKIIGTVGADPMGATRG